MFSNEKYSVMEPHSIPPVAAGCELGEGMIPIHNNSHMTNVRVEVITTVERRRRWSAVEKERLATAGLWSGGGFRLQRGTRGHS